MDIKFLAVALVAIISLQGGVETKSTLSAGNVNEIATKSIKDEVQKIIEDIKNAVENIVNKGLENLKEAKDKVEAVMKDILTKAVDTIKDLANKIKVDIADLRKKAAELGEHVVACVDEAAFLVDPLIDGAIADVQRCNARVLEHIDIIFDKVENVAKEVKDELAEIIDDASKCSILNPICWVKVSGKAAALMLRITTDVSKLIASSVIEIGQASGELAKCIALVTTDFTRAMVAIQKQAAQCLIS